MVSDIPRTIAMESVNRITIEGRITQGKGREVTSDCKTR